MSKDIILKHFNGTSYDELYPKTNVTSASSSQEINEYYGLASDATFSDVLKAIPEDVGTIKYSVKPLSQMGDKYLLCDGSAVDGAKYPELYSYLEEMPYPSQEKYFTHRTITVDISSITDITSIYTTSISMFNYINGYYVAKFYISYKNNTNGTTDMYRVIYSSDLKNPFTMVNNVSGAWLQYCNGYIIASSFTIKDTSFSCKVATDPSASWSNGPSFKYSDLASTAYYTLGNINLLYDGTSYIFSVGWTTKSGGSYCQGFCKFSSLLNTTADGFATSTEAANPLYYINGYYIFYQSKGYLLYSTSWKGPYTTTGFDTTLDKGYFGGIVYYKEKWYIFAAEDTPITSVYVSDSNNINGSYTKKTISIGMQMINSFQIKKQGLSLLVNKNSTVTSDFVIYVFDDLIDNMFIVQIPYLNGDSIGETYGSETCFSSVLSSTSSNSFEASYFIPREHLPYISEVDGVKAYIKALSGK